MFYYAGIGSRNTPNEILKTFEVLGKQLAGIGGILRSGRAIGADSAFERGCIDANGRSEIYIPWRGFPKGSELVKYPAICLDHIDLEQYILAMASVTNYHPAPDRLSEPTKKLMARNYCQIFGKNAAAPVTDFVVCYTEDGQASGGTGQAIRMANYHDIRVFNAYDFKTDLDDFMKTVTEYAKTLS